MILTVIPFTAVQAESAEKLCDWIYALSGKVKSGSCLLIAANDVHPEYRLKVQLAAEVAFEHVELTVDGQANPFKTAIEHIAANYITPWLWLEPDCVPLKPDWIRQLSDFYDGQPRKCVGAFLKNMENDTLYLAQQSIYPAFDFPPNTLIAATKCRLIQCGRFAKREDVRTDAVLFCSDSSGELINLLREEIK